MLPRPNSPVVVRYSEEPRDAYPDSSERTLWSERWVHTITNHRHTWTVCSVRWLVSRNECNACKKNPRRGCVVSPTLLRSESNLQVARVMCVLFYKRVRGTYTILSKISIFNATEKQHRACGASRRPVRHPSRRSNSRRFDCRLG